MQYPEKHQEIVAELLAGKFILESNPLFHQLHRNLDFYKTFFQKSFGHQLDTRHNYYYLTSKETQEETSRDLILFLATLAYEYHNDQRDLVKEIAEKTFSVQEIAQLIKESTQYEPLIKGTKAEDLFKFLHTWNNRNLITYTDPEKKHFRFNAPINTFLEVALDLAEEYL